MTDQPPISDDQAGEITPPSSDEGPGKGTPPSQDDRGAIQEDTPPVEKIRGLSSQLRADLCMMWTLGFVDAMKGSEAEAEDEIPSDMVEPLIKLAEGWIDSAASYIAEVYDENPELVCGVVYQGGYVLSTAMDAADGPEINLN